MKQFITYFSAIAMLAAYASCERDEVLIDIVQTQVTEPVMTDVYGFYLLNEGNMGSNKASLDYFDATTGAYNLNIYAARNPTVVKELGDVGNDIMIYGNKMYAVINCSHKVEVLTPDSARRIAQIDIPNCRYVLGHNGNLYVSSYVGMAQIDPTAPRGAVFKVDTVSLAVVGSVEVGYQPEEMTIIGDHLYVANSGGYRVPDYDNTVSVIDLNTFTVTDVMTIEQSANFHRIDSDSNGRLWLSSRGDYYGNKSNLYVIDPASKQVIKEMGVPVSDMWADGDTLYTISTEWSYVTGQNAVSYTKIDMATMEVLDHNIIKDGTEKSITLPYCIAVDPVTKDFYVCDAKSYVVSGTIYCFNRNGILQWKQTTGQIPAHIAFYGKNENIINHYYNE